MSREATPTLLHHVRRLAVAAAPDDQILTAYLTRRDEAAFAALVSRHGPMVLNLCRRILHDAHAAEDVFQATFLVLAERATAIQRRGALASWLHGVAYRLAVRAKRQRAQHAQPAGGLTACDGPADAPQDGLAWREMLAILDEELQQLPERYREPLVHCYLEGRTQDEAARLLGWSLGTLRRRLEQGRALLHARLRGRGVTLPAALASVLAAGTASVRADLRAATVAAARDLAARGVPEVSPAVAGARPGGLLLTSAAVKKAVVLAACGVALGLGLWLHGATDPGGGQVVAPPAAPLAPPPVAEAAIPEQVSRLAREAAEACGAKPPFQVLLRLAVVEAKSGRAAEARKRFQQAVDWLITDGESDYQRAMGLVLVAHYLADAGDRVSAERVLADARHMAPKIDSANSRNELLRFAAVCLAEKIDPARAIARAREIPDENYRFNVFIDTAVAQARAGDVAGAQRTVGLIRAPGYFKLRPWQAIAEAQLKAGDQKAAEVTLREALAVVEEELKQQDHWFGRKLELLIDYAVAQGRAGDRAGAKATLARVEKLLEPGSRPESTQWLARLAQAQAKVGDREAARRTVKRLSRVANDNGDERPAIASVQLALGDYEAAARDARRGGNSYILTETCLELARAGRKDTAITLARSEKLTEKRALALLVVADGILSRIPPERLPRYDGTFRLKIPAAWPAPRPRVVPEPTPQEKMQAVVQKWEKAWADFNKRLGQAKTKEERTRLLENERPSGDACANELLALARKYPREPVAMKALAWIMEFAENTAAARQALTLLREEHLNDGQIGGICTMAVYSLHGKEVNALMRAALEKSKRRAAKGQACLALADFLRLTSQRVRFVQRRRTPEDIKGFEETYGKAELHRLQAADPAALEKEAERLYERVLAEFADLFPQRGGQALGKNARAALDEIRLLAVGKTAPDITGEDLDGVKFKLSDYRGKVVVLTFWGHW
jgi:RNA polymerase sigma factor (sigma-70 family)